MTMYRIIIQPNAELDKIDPGRISRYDNNMHGPLALSREYSYADYH